MLLVNVNILLPLHPKNNYYILQLMNYDCKYQVDTILQCFKQQLLYFVDDNIVTLYSNFFGGLRICFQFYVNYKKTIPKYWQF